MHMNCNGVAVPFKARNRLPARQRGRYQGHKSLDVALPGGRFQLQTDSAYLRQHLQVEMSSTHQLEQDYVEAWAVLLSSQENDLLNVYADVFCSVYLKLDNHPDHLYLQLYDRLNRKDGVSTD